MFHALLSGSPQVAAPQLIIFLENWISSGATLSIQTQLLSVDGYCSISVSSLREEDCQITTDTGEDPSLTVNTTLIGTVVAAIVFVILAIIILVAGVLAFLKRKEKSSVRASLHK